MDLLKSYCSDESSSESSENSIVDESLQRNELRSVYLVTYSQANIEKFASRHDFAHAVVQAFSRGSAKVVHWCCCREQHQTSGQHYHVAVKLDRNQRWFSAKQFLLQEHGISVHFSSKHHNYYSAWRYVTKSDINFEESPNHPNLRENNRPLTNAASRTRRQRKRAAKTANNELDSDNDFDECEETSRQAKRRKKRLSAYDVSEIIVSNEIKTLTELQALAFQQKQEGKINLAEFLLSRTPRFVADILKSAWEIEGAQEKVNRACKSRMELLEEAKNGDCTGGCNGEWLSCAVQVLQNNNVPVAVFKEAVSELLVKGRGKYRNIMIVGPANCAKTFLLNPLTKIYTTFCNPATGSFAWVGVENAECIFLNDFRWSAQLIPWHDLLLLLEGHVVHLPAPKTHFAKDIALTADTPIFCTGKRPLTYIKNGVVDERETEMMAVRFKVFNFTHQIPRESHREIPACSRCFATLILG